MIPADNKEISMLQRHLRQMHLELRKGGAQVCVDMGYRALKALW